ncbi:MAG: thiamine phosphate synthase, partial [Gemmatimonadota bacterium]|nr:thiamine phosphate synthase [Gemmatimonadota bacterium]
MAERALPRLHLVTDDELLARPGFIAAARELLGIGGASVGLQLRGPRTSARRLHELTEALLPAARDAGALLLVNDRVDVALAAGADGVQLGARGMRPADARELLGPEARLGLSVHASAEVVDREVLDFLVVGTLFPTPSHPGRMGAGPALLRNFADTGLTRIAIGGVTPERVAELRAAGAEGVAVLGG